MPSEESYEEKIRRYSLDDLYDIKSHIARESVPDRYDILLAEIERRKAGETADPSDSVAPRDEETGESVRRTRRSPGVYAGFWARFLAYMIDGIILTPLSLFMGNGFSGSTALSDTWPFLVGLICAAYFVCFHARGGQTPGKMALKIRVVTPSFQAIGLRRALVRYLPLLLVALPATIFGYCHDTTQGSETETAITIADAFDADDVIAAFYLIGLLSIGWIWTLAEMGVLLANARNRSIHDLLAGTVVVYKNADFTELHADIEEVFS
jgi:uncharacterized RDD family membrane protein YckC